MNMVGLGKKREISKGKRIAIRQKQSIPRRLINTTNTLKFIKNIIES